MTADHGFPVGDVVVIDVEFRVEDVLTDPALVQFYVMAPDGSIFLLTTINRAGTGYFGAEFVPSAIGRHRWKITAPVGTSAAVEGSFYAYDTTLVMPEVPGG